MYGFSILNFIFRCPEVRDLFMIQYTKVPILVSWSPFVRVTDSAGHFEGLGMVFTARNCTILSPKHSGGNKDSWHGISVMEAQY